jgi:hypothetical protein
MTVERALHASSSMRIRSKIRKGDQAVGEYEAVTASGCYFQNSSNGLLRGSTRWQSSARARSLFSHVQSLLYCLHCRSGPSRSRISACRLVQRSGISAAATGLQDLCVVSARKAHGYHSSAIFYFHFQTTRGLSTATPLLTWDSRHTVLLATIGSRIASV